MPQLSDIEECSPSGSTVEAGDEHHQSKTKNDDQKDASAGLPHPSSGNNNIFHHSMGRAQGLKLRPASSPHGQHQSAPTSMTVFSPALPPPHSSTSSSSSSSSSSSERTITPPHSSHRVSSSGTVQIVSPGATSSGMAALFPGVWPSSPLGRVGEEGVVGSEASTVPAYDYQSQDRQRRRYYPLAGDGTGSGGRRMTPFWWTDDGSAAGDVPLRRGDDDGERVRLLGGGGGGARGEMRGLVNVVVHGVVLAMQSGVAVGVLTVFAWVGAWMGDDGNLSGVSGEMLRSIPSLTTTAVLILSFSTLIFHEVYLLCPVVLLYLQAAILALATVAATSMWVRCVREDNGVVKCVLVSCGTLLWVMCGIAFLRAAVVWKVTRSREDEGVGEEGGEEGQGYATLEGR
ncbi:hypothetical protein V8C44DRAFT_364024 [Trichoderma aethiopicum]